MLRLSAVWLVCGSLLFMGCDRLWPKGHNAAYPGFYASVEDGSCTGIVVEDPSKAEVYGYVSGGAIALRDLRLEDLPAYGFRRVRDGAWGKGRTFGGSIIEFNQSGEVTQMVIGKQADKALAIGPTSTGPWVTLPTQWDTFEKHFGKPLSITPYYESNAMLP
jgi:hypothetical protein